MEYSAWLRCHGSVWMRSGLLHRELSNLSIKKCRLATVRTTSISWRRTRCSSMNSKSQPNKLTILTSMLDHPIEKMYSTHFSETFALYRISYMWYTAFGAITTIIVAGLGTFVMGVSDASLVDLNLLAPCIRKYVRVESPVKKVPRKSHPNRNVIPEVDEESFASDKESALWENA